MNQLVEGETTDSAITGEFLRRYQSHVELAKPFLSEAIFIGRKINFKEEEERDKDHKIWEGDPLGKIIQSYSISWNFLIVDQAFRSAVPLFNGRQIR
ncbi:MAG: hypothetical protein CM15mV49_110 [uncultured marine virus]|nr:MAG: hypothetical protein CM15mV49_110 [uncultured marine virus]